MFLKDSVDKKLYDQSRSFVQISVRDFLCEIFLIGICLKKMINKNKNKKKIIINDFL